MLIFYFCFTMLSIFLFFHFHHYFFIYFPFVFIFLFSTTSLNYLHLWYFDRYFVLHFSMLQLTLLDLDSLYFHIHSYFLWYFYPSFCYTCRILEWCLAYCYSHLFIVLSLSLSSMVDWGSLLLLLIFLGLVSALRHLNSILISDEFTNSVICILDIWLFLGELLGFSVIVIKLFVRIYGS